jgi:hypothetical protein
MEIIGIIGITVGIITGVFGSVLSVYLAIRQKRSDRLAFLVQVIIDRNIPRESRKPFYEEYIAKGGNGTVVRFWLEDSALDAVPSNRPPASP